MKIYITHTVSIQVYTVVNYCANAVIRDSLNLIMFNRYYAVFLPK